MEAIQLPKLEVMDEIEQEAKQLVLTSQAIAVVSHEDYLFAAEQYRLIREKKKYVKDLFADSKRAADQAHKAIVAAEKKLLAPLDAAESVYGQKVVSWEREQQRREREEAERIRREAEEKAKQEAEAIRAKQEEEKKSLAALLEQNGFKAEAAEALQVQSPEPVIVPEIPNAVLVAQRAQGMHIRKTYKVEVVDLMALVKEVAEGRQPLAYLQANESKLNDVAGALKEEFKVPGCQVIEHMKPVTRLK